MQIRRKYNIGAALFSSLAIFLLAHFSGAGGRAVDENSLLDAIVSPPSTVTHMAVYGVPGYASACSGCTKTGAGTEIFFSKLRMAFDEDWISKIFFLNHAPKFAKHSLYFCGRLRGVLSEPSLSRGFDLSFSGLSPPSL